MRRLSFSAGVVSMAALAAVATGVTVPANATEGFGTKIGAAGKWVVYVEADAMSDEKQCTALFDDREQIQLTPTSMAVVFRGRGGIQAYRVRIDDAPAHALQLATGAEKGVGAAVIRGKRYDEIVAAKRLRIQAFTVLNSIIDEDIDLSGIGEVRQLFAKAGCVA